MSGKNSGQYSFKFSSMKKLYRSKTNKTLTGFLGGIGDYFSIDPIIVRLLFILFLIVTNIWPGIIIYIIGYLVVPVEPETQSSTEDKDEAR